MNLPPLAKYIIIFLLIFLFVVIFIGFYNEAKTEITSIPKRLLKATGLTILIFIIMAVMVVERGLTARRRKEFNQNITDSFIKILDPEGQVIR